MNNLTLNLFEYDKKNVSLKIESGYLYFSKNEIRQFRNLNNKIKKRDGYNQDVLYFDQQEEDRVTVESSSYVGVLRINNKSIQIIPKISRLSDNSSEFIKESIKNLLYMLSYTKKLNVSDADIASLTKTSDDFFEILIHLFAKNLLRIIQNDLYKQYIVQEENLTYIKGKLQIPAHLRQNIINKQMFFLEHDEFSEDNMINQTLKYTVNLLLKNTKSFQNLKLLQQLDAIYSDITTNSISLAEIEKIIFTRLNIKYQPIINLAKIFLPKKSIMLSSDKIETFSLVFDMNKLFEEFIGEFIKKELYSDYPFVKLQHPVRYLVDMKYCNGDLECIKKFQLKPDIQVFHDSVREVPETIIDTKYKVLEISEDAKEGVSQSDLYQMYAYSKKFNCDKIILLYPESDQNNPKNIEFKTDNNTSIFLRTVDIRKDLKINKNELKNELKNILQVEKA